MLKVIKPGIQTTVQDMGRMGFLAVGIPPSGAIDHYSLRAANLIVGNDLGDHYLSRGRIGDAGLEILLGGLEVEFGTDTVIAVTGGESDFRVNGKTMPEWAAIRIRSGDRVEVGLLKVGCRAYLAVAGGIQVPLVLGSRSTYLKGYIGGIEGRALIGGDILRLGEGKKPIDSLEGRELLEKYQLKLKKEFEIRVIKGPNDDLFSEVGLKTFFDSEWVLGPAADRMGMRFTGPRLDFKPKPSHLVKITGPEPWNIGIVDNAPCGSIQVPGGINPILLGVDSITLGGYARPVTAISVDMSRAGQMRPGDRTRFISVSLQSALDALRESLGALREENVVRR